MSMFIESAVAQGRRDRFIRGSVHANFGGTDLPQTGVFAAGTMIKTPGGLVDVRHLMDGDEVCSFKNGKVGIKSCTAFPFQYVPDYLIRIRAGYLNASQDIVLFPSQLARLDHPVAASIFGTKFPFSQVRKICIQGKIEMIPKEHQQFYFLDLGICDAVRANSVLCVAEPIRTERNDDEKALVRDFEYRELNSDELQQAIEVGGCFRYKRSKQ